MSFSSKEVQYMPNLDLIRTGAVFGVILAHWVLGDLEIKNVDFLALGGHGVDTFFVLSGFLISLILLRVKYEALEKEAFSLKEILKAFYIRRTLRIFPLYYLILLLFLIVFPIIFNTGEFKYFFTYTINWHHFLDQQLGSKLLNHLWSLSVEEQFYIIWPLVILVCPSKKEWIAISIFIAIGLFSKFYLTSLDLRFENRNTLYNFDAFGYGALLAYGLVNNVLIKPSRLKLILVSLFALSLFLSCLLFKSYTAYTINIFSLVIVYLGVWNYRKKGPSKAIKFLQYLGKISYGLYVYHKFIPFLVNLALTKVGFTLNVDPILTFMLWLTVLIFVSHLSWRLFELPINQLKRRFSY